MTITKSRNLAPNVRTEGNSTTVEETDKVIDTGSGIITSEREMGGETNRSIQNSPKFVL
jgi:hypothetical protein